MAEKSSQFEKSKKIFKNNGGVLRTSDAIKAGIHPRTLYAMLNSGVIEKLSRGLYCLAGTKIGNPDFIVVSRRVPDAVICLISAISFHDITTQIPHKVYIAVPREKWSPDIDYPPIRTFKYSRAVYRAGIEEHIIDGTPVKIYSPEKSLADCFKYRNRIGQDIAIESLKLYRERKKLKVDDIMKYARVCRVEKIMRPYLEALL